MLSKLDFAEILRLTRTTTVARILERDDFHKRFGANEPISISELLYPLMQAYDSVAVEADVELGGTDQTYNLLVGRELQRAHGQQPQIVLTVPLLEGLDGVQKMSKSLGNYVAITEPPAEQFGKLMSIPDGLVPRYAQLCTDLPPEEVRALEAAVGGGGPDAAAAKRRVAREVVGLYHGAEAATDAEGRFDLLFSQREVPTDVPEHALGPDDPVHLPAVLADAGLVASRSEARRAIDEGGVRVDGAPLEQGRYDVPRAELVGRVLQRGRRKAVRLT